MGTSHLSNMLEFRKEGKVRIAAVCDVDESRLAAAVKVPARGVQPYRDYRYILERKDIDAVVIATPDHWHAVQTVHACESGKHVYVEKPASCHDRGGQGHGRRGAEAQPRRAGRGPGPHRARGAWHTCRAIRNGIVGKVDQGHLLALRQPGRREARARLRPPPRSSTGTCGSGRCAGGRTTRATCPACSAG